MAQRLTIVLVMVMGVEGNKTMTAQLGRFKSMKTEESEGTEASELPGWAIALLVFAGVVFVASVIIASVLIVRGWKREKRLGEPESELKAPGLNKEEEDTLRKKVVERPETSEQPQPEMAIEKAVSEKPEFESESEESLSEKKHERSPENSAERVKGVSEQSARKATNGGREVDELFLDQPAGLLPSTPTNQKDPRWATSESLITDSLIHSVPYFPPSSISTALDPTTESSPNCLTRRAPTVVSLHPPL